MSRARARTRCPRTGKTFSAPFHKVKRDSLALGAQPVEVVGIVEQPADAMAARWIRTSRAGASTREWWAPGTRFFAPPVTSAPSAERQELLHPYCG